MLLRVMLVGMVTSLGLELPTENDVDSWSQAGRDWCQARLAEWDAPPALAMMPDDANAFAPDRPELAAEVPNPVEAEDLAFAAVMDETVNAFAAEQLAEAAALAFANLPEAVEVEDAIDPAVALKLEAAALANFPEVRDVEAAIDPAVVLELGRAAEPLGGAAWVAAEIAVEQDVAIDVAAEIRSSNRGDRLAAAVRLTSQAAQAWASLLQSSTALRLNP